MNKGKYIVIEGAQGVGKTTQIQKLAAMLQSTGLPVRVMREPDSQNDLTARAIRHLTQSPLYPMNTKTEVLLYNAARSQSLEIIKNNVENGIICLVDRSYLTTLAIQYYGRGDIKDYQKINEIIDFAVGDIKPDLMMVLDAPTEILKKRTNDRRSGEKFDNLDIEFLERVRAGYLWEARQRNLPVIYANGDVEEVFKSIWQEVSKLLSDRKPTETKASTVASVIAEKAVRVKNGQSYAPPELLPNVNIDKHQPNPMYSQASPVTESPAIDLNPDTITNDQPTSEPSPDQDSKKPWLNKNQAGVTYITEAGYKRLAPLVTNTKSSVYSFTDQIAPLSVAAAMARLSRRADDMRITLLDEFVDKDDKDGDLLRRVITAYGDDSVQQLVGQYIVVENASNLLTKKLEWGRLAAYLEQSTRYIYFDQKDVDGKYRYYTPDTLNEDVKQEYNLTLDAIFDIYSHMVKKLTEYVRANSTVPKADQDAAWRSATKAQACDAIRPVLPVATKSTVGIFASGQALESLIMHLMSDELAEARTVGDQILTEARKIAPAILERADKPDRGGANIAYRSETFAAVKKLAKDLLPDNYAAPTEAVTLASFSHRNELDIVPDMLYEHSSLPLSKLQDEVATWPYDKKLSVFEAYIGKRLNRRQKPGRALENIHYTWDLVCDYGIFRDLQRHRMVDDLTWQQLTPRYGYEVPQLVEDAGLEEAYMACFDLSLKLYSSLQSKGYELESQYATLLGHRMRWRVTMNAREAFHFNELRTAPQGHPGYRKLVGQMHDKLKEVHPLLGDAMKFVNQDEDPELTRLAAERYTAFKLSQLDGKN